MHAHWFDKGRANAMFTGTHEGPGKRCRWALGLLRAMIVIVGPHRSPLITLTLIRGEFEKAGRTPKPQIARRSAIVEVFDRG